MRAPASIGPECSELRLACSIRVDHPNSTAATSSRNKNDLCAVGTKGWVGVTPGKGKARLIGPIGIHHVNLRASVTVGLKCDLGSVRTDVWKIVNSCVGGES